jgi:proline iminopeptidase
LNRKAYLLFFLCSAVTLFSRSALAGENQEALQSGSHLVQLGDVYIHYVVAGHGPLVFVTSVGWGLSSVIYQNGFKPLEKQFTIVYVDERGNGESSRPADLKQMSSTVMADDLDRLRTHLGLDKIMLIGHSSGGTIALEYAERHPTHLEKGVLIDAEVLGDEEARQTEEFLSLWKNDPKYRDAINNEQKSDEQPQTDAEATKILESYISLYFSNPGRDVPVFLKQVGDSQVSAVTQNAHAKADQIAGRQQREDFGSIQGKLLIINGTVDWICPYQPAQRLHASVPGSVLDLYANVGHLPWIEEPERFFREVTDFLNQ